MGASEEQLVGLGEGDLVGLAGDLQLATGLDLDLHQLAAASGCTVNEAQSVYEQLGLGVDHLAGFGAGDVALLQLLSNDTTGMAEQVAPSILRVLGTAMARVADATVAAYVQDIEPEAVQKMDALQLADQNALGSALALEFADCLSTVFRHHMWVAVRRQRSAQLGVAMPQVVRMAVAFVDLVGFTSLSRFASPAELLATVESFERRAFEIAHRLGGRIIKSIGDEVMVAAHDAAAVSQIALQLVRERRDDDTVLARAGVSAGDVLFRLGDYYGPVVNLASRLTNEAVPDEVLAERTIAESPGVEAVAAGRRSLKGFTEPVEVWTVTSTELG